MPTLKVTTKRVEEIEDIQNRVRKLAAEYKNDFTKPHALDRIIDKDLESTVYSLELLKGVYSPRRRNKPDT